MRVLIIEDDKKIAAFIAKGLKEEMMSVDVAHHAKDGLYLASVTSYDVMIIDWMLPGMSGVELIETIRKLENSVPILLLTARQDVEDRVQGLQRGADDYLVKPFAFTELVARIQALHRRHGYAKENVIEVDSLRINLITHDVYREDRRIDLSAKEYELLELFVRYRGKVVTNTMITESIWNMQEQIDSNVINVTVHNLRKKIDAGFGTKLIETVRGSGFRFAAH